MADHAQPSFHDFTQRVKDAVAIEQVIAEYVPGLTQRGSSFKACCPFHGEKTPSFHVHPDRGFYHCFGCGVHGDVIKFVQEIEKVDFMMALEMLARRAGMEMPRFSRRDAGERERDDQRLAQLREICTWAAEFFVAQLDEHPRGKIARDYLHGRELDDAQIREYGLGYAPPGYEDIQAAAAQRGFSDELLAEAGLVTRRDSGGFTDRFRDRVIFPVADPYGQIIAFAGRILDPDAHPAKYINSAETAIFKKGRMLYGLDRAREAIKTENCAVLLEGYMDWLSMHSSGLRHVLAGMGTALTEDQTRLIKRQTRKVILLYDGDEAGAKAMFRSAQLLLAQGLEVAAGILPDGLDPDDFIHKHGTQALRKILTQAPPVVDYISQRLAAGADMNQPQAKAEAVGKIAPLLMAITDPVLREGFTTMAAGRFGVRPETLEAALTQRQPRPRREWAEDAQPEETPSPIAISGTEQNLLYILLNHWGAEELFRLVVPDWFASELAQLLFERIAQVSRDVREGADPPEDWFELCQNDAERDWMSRLMLLPSERFGGEIAGFDAATEDAFRLQCLKLKRQWDRRIRQQLTQDLRLIALEDPKARAALERAETIARGHIQDTGDYLANRPRTH